MMPSLVPNWKSVRTAQGTVFDVLNRNFTSKPNVVPSFADCGSILIGSDYSGESNGEPYVVYSFLLVGDIAWAAWESTRLLLRQQIFNDDRRMSYKKLGDKYRRQFLKPILHAADELNGLSISLAINKSAPALFSDASPLDLSNPDFAVFRDWKPAVLNKAFSLLHIAGFLLAGLGKSMQNVFWLTDEDQIAANTRMLTALTKAFAWISSEYLDFDLGHLRCGTTACDSGDRQIEDFVCIPDLIAGALSEQFRSSTAMGIRDDKILWITGAGMNDKAQPILTWLATSQGKLKKHAFVIDPSEDSETHKVSWFNYGNGSEGSK